MSCELCGGKLGDFWTSQPCGQCQCMIDNIPRGMGKLIKMLLARVIGLQGQLDNLKYEIRRQK